MKRIGYIAGKRIKDLPTESIEDGAVTTPKIAAGAAPRTRTLTVAASDSSPDDKTQADYLCDGTADDVTIQAALDALPATGGIVQLLEGNFACTGRITLGLHNVTLEGQGMGSTILTFTFAAAADTCVRVNGHADAVKNLKIVCAAASGDAGGRPSGIHIAPNDFDTDIVTNARIENVWLLGDLTVADDNRNEGQNGINCQLARDFVFTGCKIENWQRYGIALNWSGSYRGVITENEILACAQVGIRAWGTVEEVVIKGNILIGNATNIYMYDATVTDITIESNICKDASSDAPHFGCGIDVVRTVRVVIVGNVVEGNAREGINVEYTENAVVSGNISDNNGLNGIQVYQAQNSVISGNSCDGNTGSGVVIIAPADRNIIIGNNLLTNGAALTDGGTNTLSTGAGAWNVVA